MVLETVVILAAGEGTRMKSSTPKVLHTVAGRTLVGHVVHAVTSLQPKNVRIVVGAGREEVEAHIGEISPHVSQSFKKNAAALDMQRNWRSLAFRHQARFW